MNIFDIHNEQAQLFKELDENGGELTPELEKRFDDLEIKREEKLEGWIKWLANTTAEIDAVKAYQAGLAKKKETLEKRLKGIKNTLSLLIDDDEKFSFPVGSVHTRRSQTCECIDEELVPKEYRKIEVKEKILLDKAKKSILSSGTSIAGFKICESKKAIVRLSK